MVPLSPEAEDGGPRPGLRERKRLRTRAAIQRHAIRLFRAQGYPATTISQIAAAADVSESTLFRYFSTKEALVFEDDFDEPMIAAIRNQPAELNAIKALRGAFREVLGGLTVEQRAEIQVRAELALSVPELRAAVAGRMIDQLDETSRVLAARSGRPPEDLRVRALAGAALGAMLAIMMAPLQALTADYVDLADTALAELEAGFST